MLIGASEILTHLKHGTPQGILHVGAHSAEEIHLYSELGVSRVAWIEANPALISRLISNTALHVGSSVHFFAALDEDGVLIDLNIANNGESSSVLQFETHTKEHPHIHFVAKTKVPCWKIDTFLSQKGFSKDLFDFVNIDVQGAELRVLKGMHNQLFYVKYAYLEVNEKFLYKDCALIHEIDEFLLQYGFKRVITKMTQHGWGDAFYVKEMQI